jgi:hypothetical protein
MRSADAPELADICRACFSRSRRVPGPGVTPARIIRAALPPAWAESRSGWSVEISGEERPADAGRRTGRAFAADRRRWGVLVPAGLPPEKIRMIIAGQSIAFLRVFWQAMTTG